MLQNHTESNKIISVERDHVSSAPTSFLGNDQRLTKFSLMVHPSKIKRSPRVYLTPSFSTLSSVQIVVTYISSGWSSHRTLDCLVLHLDCTRYTALETDQYDGLKRNPFRNSRSQEIDAQESDRLDRNVPLVWIVIGTQWAEHLRRIKGHDQKICSINTCT